MGPKTTPPFEEEAFVYLTIDLRRSTERNREPTFIKGGEKTLRFDNNPVDEEMLAEFRNRCQ